MINHHRLNFNYLERVLPLDPPLDLEGAGLELVGRELLVVGLLTVGVGL